MVTRDIVISPSGSTFNVDTILTGPAIYLYEGIYAQLDILIGVDGNLLTGL